MKRSRADREDFFIITRLNLCREEDKQRIKTSDDQRFRGWSFSNFIAWRVSVKTDPFPTWLSTVIIP
jgi:hypothetical protein